MRSCRSEALTQALPPVDHQLPVGAAAEVEELLRATVFFIHRVASGGSEMKCAFGISAVWEGFFIFCKRAHLHTCGACLRWSAGGCWRLSLLPATQEGLCWGWGGSCPAWWGCHTPAAPCSQDAPADHKSRRTDYNRGLFFFVCRHCVQSWRQVTSLAISFLLFSSRFSSSLLWISAMISFSCRIQRHLSQRPDTWLFKVLLR